MTLASPLWSIPSGSPTIMLFEFIIVLMRATRPVHLTVLCFKLSLGPFSEMKLLDHNLLNYVKKRPVFHLDTNDLQKLQRTSVLFGHQQLQKADVSPHVATTAFMGQVTQTVFRNGFSLSSLVISIAGNICEPLHGGIIPLKWLSLWLHTSYRTNW